MTPNRILEREQQRRSRQRALSVVEFAQRYGVGRTTTYEEIKSGRLPARKIGKRTIITVDDAEEWLSRLPVLGAAK
ncbi:helix-turn-helix domain-containing protein [Bradyrhizobium sp. AUGA SZCCT0158]|nr:helix-turn-helix domain-containing protein [Bradyrhizobium sp. AUGA SZCCT0158]